MRAIDSLTKVMKLYHRHWRTAMHLGFEWKGKQSKQRYKIM